MGKGERGEVFERLLCLGRLRARLDGAMARGASCFRPKAFVEYETYGEEKSP